MPSVSASRERGREVMDQAAPAFEDAQAGPAGVADPPDHGADHGVEPGTITTTGQQADFHGTSRAND